MATEGQLGGGEEIPDGAGTWWVAATRPRYEARLVRELVALDAPRALFLQEPVRRVHHDAKGHAHRRVEMRPLFPRYVFFCGGSDHRYAASRSRSTLQVIDVVDQARLVRELRRLDWAIATRAAEPPAAQFRRDQMVEVIDGALRGLRGIVLGAIAGGLLKIECKLLGASREVEIAPELIEAL